MNRRVLWIDDNEEVLAEGAAILQSIGGIDPSMARSSSEAQQAHESGQVDTVITDILRRNAAGGIAGDDGYQFFTAYIRPAYPTLHVIFHTKNLPSSFAVDENSGYLSKWEKYREKEDRA